MSTDGGNTFSPQTYANASTLAIESPTGDAVNLGPIPDNESSGNPNAETLFRIRPAPGPRRRRRQDLRRLVVEREQGSSTAKVPLSIVDSVLTIADGPRIVSSTMGPVGLPGDAINTTVAADGSPVANTFEVTFDRPVDPATFQGDGATAPIGSGDVGSSTRTPTPRPSSTTRTSLSLVGGSRAPRPSPRPTCRGCRSSTARSRSRSRAIPTSRASPSR